MRKFLLCLVVSIYATTAMADIQDEVQKLALAGDYESIETLLEKVHAESVKTKNYDDIRVSNAPFSTTNQDIIQTVDAWVSEMPDSPYANAAAAWVHNRLAHEYRGSSIGYQVSKFAWEAYRTKKRLAHTHAWAAYEAAPDYRAASDAIIRTREGGMSDEQVLEFVQDVIATGSDFGTVNRANQQIGSMWGGSLQNIHTLCTLNDGASGIHYDRCVALGLIYNNAPGEQQHLAFKLLRAEEEEGKHENPYTLKGYTEGYYPITGDNERDVYNLMVEATKNGLNLQTAEHMAYTLSHRGPLPNLLMLDVRNAYMGVAKARLEIDTHNTELILGYIKNSLDNFGEVRDGETAETLYELWKRSVKYGQYQREVWLKGAHLVRKMEHDELKALKVSYPYYINASVFSTEPETPLAMQLNFFYAADQDARTELKKASDTQKIADLEAIINFTQCPILRSARLVKAYCEINERNSSTCEETWLSTGRADEILANDQILQACPSEANASLYDLQHSPIPLEQFGAWATE